MTTPTTHISFMLKPNLDNVLRLRSRAVKDQLGGTLSAEKTGRLDRALALALGLPLPG